MVTVIFLYAESYTNFTGGNISFWFRCETAEWTSFKNLRFRYVPYGNGIIKRVDVIDYLHMQLRLEGKSVVGENSLRQVEIVPDEEIPLITIASLSSRELVVYYDGTLSLELRKNLDKQIHPLNFPNIDPIIDALKFKNLKLEVGHFKTYIFPECYKDLDFDEVIRYPKTAPKVQAFGFDGFTEQVHAIERDGKIVSACVSTRENGHCGEAWVYTDPEYRHQGFAQKVVSIWARDLMLTGKVPFYSHKIDNLASAKLAKRLELEPVFEEITVLKKCATP